jgi:lipoprotein-anchoring transpeptidase ErfK/SrfK
MSASRRSRHLCSLVLCAGFLTTGVVPALAQALSFLPADRYDQVLPQYTPQDQTVGTDELPAPLQRQVVPYQTDEAAGTIIIDTAHTFLYLTLGDGKALRYGIGVGREGFTWSGVEAIARKAEWPDWIPPAEMVARQPYLPRWVGGGPGNPLGARALYLGNTQYRIHGTNDPTTIGKHVSSGCIRLRNEDVIDLYDRVDVGTKVVVLPNAQRSASIEPPQAAPRPPHTSTVDYQPRAAAPTKPALSRIY